MFALYVAITIYDIFAIEMCMTTALTFRIGRIELKMQIARAYSSSYLMVIVAFAQSFTIYRDICIEWLDAVKLDFDRDRYSSRVFCHASPSPCISRSSYNL